MKLKISSKKVLLTAGLVLAVASQQGHAAGFAIIEDSASGMGNAFAGAAAVGEDASTIWFNPAAMTHVGKHQVMTAIHAIDPSAEYTDKGSFINPAFTGGTPAPGSLTGKNDDGGELGIVPNLFYMKPLGPDVYFGLGINAPFGLTTEYDDDWVGRYHAIKSELKTVNINPSFAWKLGSKFSIGVGLNLQYVDVELSNAIDSGATCLGIANMAGSAALQAACVGAGLTPNQQARDSKVVIEGDDWSYGFNFGFLYEASPMTRAGFSYRSAIEHGLKGDADFTLDPGLSGIIASLSPSPFSLFLQDSAVHAGVELPAQASISLAHSINPTVELLLDATWTDWSTFKELRIDFDNPVQPDGVTEENWEDNWRFSFGANIRPNPKLVVRAGVAVDYTPIPSPQFRTPRIPGNDRVWASLGAGYDITPNVHADLGYAHLFISDTDIDHASSSGTLRGTYEADVNIFSAGLTLTF